eukprot:Pgem_evm2s3736
MVTKTKIKDKRISQSKPKYNDSYDVDTVYNVDSSSSDDDDDDDSRGHGVEYNESNCNSSTNFTSCNNSTSKTDKRLFQ